MSGLICHLWIRLHQANTATGSRSERKLTCCILKTDGLSSFLEKCQKCLAWLCRRDESWLQNDHLLLRYFACLKLRGGDFKERSLLDLKFEHTFSGIL